MARRVLMAEVRGERVQGRPMLGWMDGVKVVFGSRGMTGGCATMRERWEEVESPFAYVVYSVSVGHFCMVRLFFRTALPRSGGLSPGVVWDVT